MFSKLFKQDTFSPLGGWYSKGGVWLRGISCKGRFEVGKGRARAYASGGILAKPIEEKGKGTSVSLALGGRGSRG